jgi:tetratricopeptide (TPR) repeat protein
LPLFKAVQDQLGQANLLKSLGDLERRLGHLEAARSHYDAALPLYKAEQSQLGQANLLKSLGDLERRLGHLEAARSHYDAALPLFKAVQDQLGQANLLKSLGDLERRLGHLEAARSHYDAALPLFKAEQSQLGQANLLKSLGDLERHLGHLEEARRHYDAALPLFKAVQDQLGQANVYMSIADMFLAQKEWEQARSYYEQALPLFMAVQDPLGQANTLIDLGRVRFELGEREQGIKDVERAASLFRSLQDDEWARRAELYLAQMRAVLRQAKTDSSRASSGEKDLLAAFLGVKSSAEMLELVQQHPELLSDEWFATIEAPIEAQQDEEAKRYLGERLDTLKQIREAGQQERAIVADIAQALDEFARADWGKRRELLQSRGELLLSKAVEPVCDILVEANKENGSVVALLQSLRVLLRRCRTWGVDAAFYFAMQMRLGDEVDIPAAYEDAVMQAAGLLARRGEDGEALAQAVEAMEKLVQSLPTDQKGLFRGALLRDLADATLSLPRKHPLRRLEAIEAYYREALAIYQDQAPDRPISQAVIQRALGEALSEQGRYGEAAETLQAAIQGFKGNEGRTSDTAWALSSYASALDNLGREEEALAAYNEAIELLPDTAPLLRNRTETLISLRRLEEAEADLARAVELDGNENSAYLWFRRAQLAIARGDGTQAEQMIEEVLKRDASFDVLAVQAQSAWLRGDLATAQEKLRQALDHANQGTRAATRREMERLLEEHPELAAGDEIRAMLNEDEK